MVNNKLFSDLRLELRRNHKITKDKINFVPFEDWRKKLANYSEKFPLEYQRDLKILRKKFGFKSLKPLVNKKKKLILFSALPGLGKTTLAKIIEKKIANTVLLRGHDIVDILHLYGSRKRTYKSRLKARGFVYPDPWYISYLYQESLMGELLDLGYNVVFDDHIRTKVNRRGYYRFAKKHNAEMVFVQINAPFALSLERRKKEGNLSFWSRFVFQSQDFSDAEIRNYARVIEVDGTSKLADIERMLVLKLGRN